MSKIRENEMAGLPLDDAIVKAIGYCIKNGIMSGYLERNSSEVQNMLFVEYNLEDDKQVSYDEGKIDGLAEGKIVGKAEGKIEGRAEGITEGKIAGKAEGITEGKIEGKSEVARNLKSKGFSAEVIAEATDLSIEEIEKL
jgi:predicted transposase/invertase (TIGR01784 family)